MRACRILIIYFLFIGCLFAQNQIPEVKVQIGHTSNISRVIISPDGKLALSASWDKTMILWELASGRQVRSFEGHTARVNSVCFSPDGKYIYSGSDDKTMVLWEVSTGKILKKSEINEDGIISIALSADGKIIASSEGNKIKIRDAISMSLIKTINCNSGTISSISFSSDGNSIISCANRELVLWDVNTGEIIREFEKNNYGYYSPVFSPDGKYILTGSGDRVVRLNEVSTGKLIRTFEGHESRVSVVAFSPDGNFVLSGSDDKTVSLWNINNSQKINSFNSHGEDVRSICFTPDGKYVLSSTPSEVMLSESGTGRFVRSFEGHTSAISSIVYTPDGKNILTGCTDNTLKLWEVSTGRLVSVFEGHNDFIKTVAVSSDGKYAVSGSADNTVRLWDIASAKLVKTFEGHKDFITSVAISPNGEFILSGSGDNTVKLWSVYTGRVIHTFTGHQWYVTSVGFSPDGNFAVSGGYDNIVIIWDLNKNKFYKSFESPERILTVAFSPDGSKILSGGCDNMLTLWDIETGKRVKTFEEHEYYVTSAVFSGDGKFILSGSEDYSVKLWNVSTAKCIKTFKGHTGIISSVCISPESKFAISSSTDHKMKMWDISSGNEIVNFITYYGTDYFLITPDNYYLSSRNGVKVVAFVIGNDAYPPEQYDLHYNRPDIVLKRIGLAPDNLIEAYEKAYLRRLKKMNFNENMFNNDFQLPEVKILTDKIPLTTEEKNLKIRIEAEDAKYNLDRLNVFVNDVPLYGSGGINLKDFNSKVYQTDLDIELSKNRNKIQISVLNEKGTESLFQTFDINYETGITKPDLYILSIGVSEYNNTKYTLKYASKDAKDIAELMNTDRERYNEIKTLEILDKGATGQNILRAKEFLVNSKVDDEVIVFIAGHGVLSKNFDYYFATADMDFANPELKGITFEEIESLLDGIPARKKVVFMDTCHSGEIDKDDVREIKKKKVEAGEVSFRSVGESEYESKSEKKLGLKNISLLLQNMFINLRHGSGAVVISSSGGLEFSFEGSGYKNGIFTYCLIEGIKTKNADLNNDGEITVNELKSYVSNKVEKLTNGAQRPTSRRENLDFDFIIW